MYLELASSVDTGLQIAFIQPASCLLVVLFSIKVFYSIRTGASAASQHPYSSLHACVHPYNCLLFVLLTQVDSPRRGGGASHLDALPPPIQTVHKLALESGTLTAEQ